MDSCGDEIHPADSLTRPFPLSDAAHIKQMGRKGFNVPDPSPYLTAALPQN